MAMEVVIDGNSLTLEQVTAVAAARTRVSVAPWAKTRAGAARKVVDRLVESRAVAYGVTTGFGKLSDVAIPPDRLAELQVNLVRSHAAGVGDLLPEREVRAMMLLRANVLARGTSGVRPAVPELLVEMLNRKIHPTVPSQGSVGASGDLAPLSHLALAMIGEGEVRVPNPITLEAKEGLAFVNGTQAQTGLAALLVTDAWMLWRTAHGAAAMSLEAVRGSPEPFDSRIHDARPHA